MGGFLSRHIVRHFSVDGAGHIVYSPVRYVLAWPQFARPLTRIELPSNVRGYSLAVKLLRKESYFFKSFFQCSSDANLESETCVDFHKRVE